MADTLNMAQSGNLIGSGVRREAIANGEAKYTDGAVACGERISAKGILRSKVRELRQQAMSLEALAASLPEEMNPQAESALIALAAKN